MIAPVDPYIEAYAKAGADRITAHLEAGPHVHRTLQAIRGAGCKAGLALNPGTGIEAVSHLLDDIDLLCVMTVNPGFGGQDYIATMEPKVAEVRRMVLEGGHDVDVEVDGGIGPATIAGAAAAGANVLVAGSALYRDPAGLAHAVTELRSLAEATRS
jgi:ribulose-phosphate 3-epimerase